MKILLTLDFPPEKGGIQKYLFGIVQHCDQSNDCVFYGGFEFQKSAYDGLKTKIIPATWWPGRINKKLAIPVLLLRLFLVAIAKKNMIIECGNVYAGIPAWLLFLLTGKSYRVYTYGTELLGLHRRGLYSGVIRAVLKKAERLYVLGHYTRSLLAAGGIKTETEMVPPRIELPSGCEKIRSPLLKAESSVTILCVGRLVHHKGQHVLLSALAQLPDPLGWRAIFIGDGPEKIRLEELCRNKNLDSKVGFHGVISDQKLHELYRAASVLVLPSLETSAGTEGFGMVLLEAMAHSVLVIASNIGGIPEVLDNGGCGMLVPPGDPAALAKAIMQVCGDDVMRDALVQKAHDRILKHYVW